MIEHRMSERGWFISLEGGEGAGKSTLADGLQSRLEECGRTVLRTREPGGTGFGEAVRAVVLDPAHTDVSAWAELFLMLAARAQLVDEKIRPALARGEVVLCDRFADASVAYQGVGRGLGFDAVRELNLRATAGCMPDLTLFLDLDPRVGMVQARWEHINRDDSPLTGAQAVLLDGHFVMEHGARCRSGRFMSFNGTAGVWRKSCIEDAGGWSHDTLTEDLDLSYRAQMKGWRFVFLPDLACPAELPPEMESFKSQQHRWAKGGAQTCRKMLPTILQSDQPAKIKLEAFFHLTSCTVYVSMVALILLLAPALWISYLRDGRGATPLSWLIDVGLLLAATCSVSLFYVYSQRELSRSWGESLKCLPLLMSLGAGISLNNARATLEGFLGGGKSEFVRTPKFGVEGGHRNEWKRRSGYGLPVTFKWQPYCELAIGVYLLACLVFCALAGWAMLGMLFMGIFSVGFVYVGLASLRSLKLGAG